MGKSDHHVYAPKPANTIQKQVSQRVTEERVEIRGPLPQANEFEHYESTLPGAADRILAMAEREALHRQGLDVKMVDASIRQSGIGQWLGLISILASCAVIVYGIHEGVPLAFIPGTITGLASLAAVFTNIGKNKK